jgi:RNA polymerase sigma factor (sigma-70 family)
MTLIWQRPAPSQDAEFELEVSTQRWTWAPSIYDIVALPTSIQPTTRILLTSKHPDDRLFTQRALADAVITRQSFRYESRIVRGDGYLRILETRADICLASDGSPSAVVGSCIVVSDWAIPVFEIPSKLGLGEGDLAVALLAHNQEAHEYAYRSYGGLVTTVGACILGNSTQADDVAQAVFEDLWLRPGRFDPSRGSLGVYLKMQARTRSLDLWRSEHARQHRELRGFQNGEGPRVDDYLNRLARMDIDTMLGLLPPTERAPIELAYFHDMTYRDDDCARYRQ